MAYKILKYAKIANGSIELNGHKVFEAQPGAGFKDFAREAYSILGIEYPKFHKMDSLSKLGILASELMSDIITGCQDAACVFMNSSSSLAADSIYASSMDSLPSPALFVYTLPNIVIGEISIKHGIKGENAFFVEPSFNAMLLHSYCQQLQNPGGVCLAGWLEMGASNNYEAFVIAAADSADESLLQFSCVNLETLYKN
jgi:hypothetical protein